MARSRMRMPSKRLIASYIFDWIVIILMAGVGGAINSISPYHRPFSLTDLSISFPYVPKEQISVQLLAVIGLIIPAVIIAIVCLVLVPGRTATSQTPKALIWRRKVWEWNTGWMGLALSLASSFLFSEGLKNIFGKPRPDLLARCNPDIANLADHALTKFATGFSPEWVLVSSSICRPISRETLDDGFRSFPSGHSTFAWAGLLYLSLFLCSKFAIAIPFLPPRPHSTDPAYTAFEQQQSPALPMYHSHEMSDMSKQSEPINASTPLHPTQAAIEHVIHIRNHAAAPPVWTIVLAIAPVITAIFICSTRYAQFFHFGEDIIGGAVLGVISSYGSFRWYHLPVSRGAGWSWGARSTNRAWFVGIGELGYVGTEGWGSAGTRPMNDGGAAREEAGEASFDAGAGAGAVGPTAGSRREME